jgi:hypothetical protein
MILVELTPEGKITSSALKSRVGVKAVVGVELHALAQVEGVLQPSSDTSQLSARPGMTSVVPRLNSTRRL